MALDAVSGAHRIRQKRAIKNEATCFSNPSGKSIFPKPSLAFDLPERSLVEPAGTKKLLPRRFSKSFCPLLAVFLLGLLSHPAFAEPPLTDKEYYQLWDKIREGPRSTDDFTIWNRENEYRPFRPIKAFMVGLSLLTVGGDNHGLNRDNLEEYVKLRFANDLKNYSTDISDKKFENLKRGEWVQFSCDVRTVGKDDPIAYYIECTASTGTNRFIDGLWWYNDKWEDWTLNYTSKALLREAVKDDLAYLVERFAVFFLKAKGAM